MNLQIIRQNLQLDTIVLFAPEEILAATDIYLQKSCLIADDRGLTIICPEGTAQSVTPIRWVEYPEYGFQKVENGRENLWFAARSYLRTARHIGYVKYTAPASLICEAKSVSMTESGSFTDGGIFQKQYKDISQVIYHAMYCKSDVFFEKYKAVKQLNTAAYDRIREHIHSGCSEQELCTTVKEAYVQNASPQVLYTGDFLSGKRTCDISGPATARIIEKGDTIIVDALCACEGIYCDTTRTWFCGEPDKDILNAYTILNDILAETAPLLQPGAMASDIYSFVHRRLIREGYAGLPHHAGHGLGYSWYEAPFFITDCSELLQENMLVALEPGIYIPGRFGLRLENNYRITKNGGVDVFCYTQNIDDFIIS